MTSVGEDIKNVYRDGKQEFSESSLAEKSMLAANIGFIACEWIGNEAVLGLIGGNVLRHTGNTLLTATITGSSSFAEQSVFGLATAISINNFPKVMDSIGSKIEARRADSFNALSDEQISTSLKTRLADRFLTAFSIGTTGAALKSNAVKRKPLKTNAKNVITDAGLIGGGVATVAGVAAAATNVGKSIGLQSEANIFVDIISNPFTYLGLFSARLGFSHFKRTKV